MANNHYDRSIKMYDEPHAPEKLDQMVSSGSINKGKFLKPAHIGSYQTQMDEIYSLGVSSVLEVGPGAGFVARNLRELGIKHDTLDFESVYKPTIVADFSKFDPVGHEASYDLTCAFQVLEHFPFSIFADNLLKLKFISKRYVFISIPFSCSGFRVGAHLQKGQNKRLSKKLSFYWPTNLPNRKYREAYMKEFPWAVHYWEIGRKGFSLKHVTKTISDCGLKILQQFHGPNPFHYFYLLEKEQ